MTSLTDKFQFQNKEEGRTFLKEIGLTLSKYSDALVIPIEFPDRYPIVCQATGAPWGIGYLEDEGLLVFGDTEGSKDLGHLSSEGYLILRGYQDKIRESYKNK